MESLEFQCLSHLDRLAEHLRGASTPDPAALALAAALVPDPFEWCAVDLVAPAAPVARPAALAPEGNAVRREVEAVRAELVNEVLGGGGSEGVVRGDAMAAPMRGCDRLVGVVTAGRSGLAADDRRAAALMRLLAQAAHLGAAAVERAELARERSELFSIVSHDLRNPLGVILLVIDLLSDAELGAELARQMGKLERAARTMSHIVNDLVEAGQLDLGKLQIERQRTSAREVLDRACQAVQAAADDKQVRLDGALAGDGGGGAVGEPGAPSPWVELDAGRIVEALAQLLASAIRRTPPGGRVRVALSQQSDRAVWTVVGGVPSASDSSDAPGTSPHRVDAGLSWLLARGTVRAHGGALWLEPVEDGASAVHMSLPLAAPA